MTYNVSSGTLSLYTTTTTTRMKQSYGQVPFVAHFTELWISGGLEETKSARLNFTHAERPGPSLPNYCPHRCAGRARGLSGAPHFPPRLFLRLH